MNVKKVFHSISYLQYPLLLLAVFYALRPYFVGFDTIWCSINQMLIFAGLGVSFSTFQDTKKTQNAFSKRIWEHPKKGKRALVLMSLLTVGLLLLGMYGLYISDGEILTEISFGVIVLGIGYIGVLKSAVEMFENHRKDKNPAVEPG